MPVFKDHSFRFGSSAAAGADTVYTINQSIRFNSPDNAHMDRTPSSASNQKTYTFSVWVKRARLGSRQYLFTAFDGNNTNVGMSMLRFQADDTLAWTGYTDIWRRTNQVFRDPSAWYHIVLSVDTTHDIGDERQRIYINGERVTSFATSADMAYDTAYAINGNHAHAIGIGLGNQSSYDFDGYMSEIHFLDGYAYGPEYFGELNSSNIWIPKQYTGSYGTNGFYIKGQDSSDLGNDSSGNNNDYTVSGLAAHDQVTDTPNNSFAVINSVYSTRTTSGAGSTHTVENGNLFQQADSYSTSNYGARPFTVQPLNRGKWYFEFEGNVEAGGGNLVHVVISEESAFYAAQGAQSTNRYGIYLESGSAMYILYPGASRQETNAPIAQYTKIIGCATDLDNAKMYFFVDGTEIHGQTIATETAATNLSGWSTSSNWIFQFATVVSSANSPRSNIIFNFGQEGTFAGTQTAGGNSDSNGIGNFKHSVPSGYLALCTRNLFTD